MNDLARVALFTSALAATAAFAQTYPNKPIRVIVPYPAAGGSDMILRSLMPGGGTSEAWTAEVRASVARWAEVVKRANIKIE